jgi:hypothetical protein
MHEASCEGPHSRMPVPLPAASSHDPEGWGSAVITAVYGVPIRLIGLHLCGSQNAIS